MMSFKHEDFEYIDIHTHFFPPNIFKAIWNFFELKDPQGNVQGWPINYKLSTQELVNFLESKNVKFFTSLNYAHKEGVAKYINEWTIDFVKKHDNCISFGCVWPGDEDKEEYIRKLFEDNDFTGLKVQPLVQDFYAWDDRMDQIYKMIVDNGKWFLIHAGTAPYKNKYVGFKHFERFIHKYPDIQVIVAHFGAFEYRKFLRLLDKHENMYLDTAMVYIPDNIFRERTVKRPDIEEIISYQDRILFGSDFPNIPYEYERSTKGLLELDLPRKVYEKIFFKNAKTLFNVG